MKSYWAQGFSNVSLNEVCRLAKTSKPAIYREFGGEDGLMEATLQHYYDQVLIGVDKIFASGLPFDEIIEFWISVSLDACANSEHPPGCLFVAMSNAPAAVGQATRKSIEDVREKVLAVYENWFEHAKRTEKFSKDISSKRAALYLHAQFCHAMARNAAGEPIENTKDVLRLAVSIFRTEPLLRKI